MKNKFIKLFSLVFITLLLLVLVACDGPSIKTHYTLTYSVSGNGYIECIYESGETIEANTYINLVAKGNGSFQGWYENEELYDSGNDLLIILNKDMNLVAKFSGTNYKDDTYTLVKDLKADENHKVCASVVAVHERGYLLKDSSGYVMVYLGSNAQ